MEPVDALASDSVTPDVAVVDCAATPSGLRARFRFEGNASDHTGTFDGLAVDDQHYGPGKYGMAFELDGFNDVVTIADDELLWPAYSLTLEAWVRTTELAEQAVICKYDCGGSSMQCPSGSPYYCLRLDAGTHPTFDIRATGAAGVATVTASSSPVNNGAWHHLVAVRDSSAKSLSLYVDGLIAIASDPAMEQFGPMTSQDGELDPLVVGGRATNLSTYWQYLFKGSIDEVAIYHAAVTAAEVSAIYKASAGKCL
jgi:hypothetical protein